MVTFLSVVLLGLLLTGLPIAFAIGMATLTSLWLYTTVPLVVIPQRVIVSLNSYVMLAIPLFVLAVKQSDLIGKIKPHAPA